MVWYWLFVRVGSWYVSLTVYRTRYMSHDVQPCVQPSAHLGTVQLPYSRVRANRYGYDLRLYVLIL